MNFRKLFFLVLMFSGVLFFTSCEEEDVTPQYPNILELAQSSPNLSTLEAAIERAELTEAIESSVVKTVFAPNNDAFQALLDSNPSWNTLEDIDKVTLQNILLFHIIRGNVRGEDLVDSYVNTFSVGPNDEFVSLQINVTGGVRFNGSARPLTSNIQASNGVVHIIDEVMLPPSVVSIAINNSDFSMLVDALTRSDLSTDFVDILSSEGPFTIFAPTNQAFMDMIAASSEWSSLDDIPTPTLEAVLSYHAISGENVQADALFEGQELNTLGGMLEVNLSGGPGLRTTSGQSTNIIFANIQGTNGVVHAIDQVLIP